MEAKKMKKSFLCRTSTTAAVFSLCRFAGAVQYLVEGNMKGGVEMTVEMTAEEQSALLQILENCIADLRMGIADTGSSLFKEGLRDRKVLLEGILKKVRAMQAVETAA